MVIKQQNLTSFQAKNLNIFMEVDITIFMMTITTESVTRNKS